MTAAQLAGSTGHNKANPAASDSTTLPPNPTTTAARAVTPEPATTLAPAAPTNPDPADVTTSFSAPGPAGTTISLVASEGTGATGDVCYRVTESDYGMATEPGKETFQPLSSCIPAVDVHPRNQPVGEVTGMLYRTHSGIPYMINLGQAKDATSVTYTFADQTTATEKVVNGWYLNSMTYAQSVAGYTVTAYNAKGQQTGSWQVAPDCQEGSTTC